MTMSDEPAEAVAAPADAAVDAPPPPENATLLARDAIALAQHSLAHALALAMQNAVAYQQMMNTLNVALVAQLAGGAAAEPAAGVRQALDVMAGNGPAKQVAELSELAARLQTMLGEPTDLPRRPRPSATRRPVKSNHAT